MKVYFDGGCGPKNPGGIATYGFAIYDPNHVEMYTEGGFIGEGDGMTNNVAEYTGMIRGLQYVLDHYEVRDVEVFGDSNMIINMMTRKWGFRKGVYNPHPDKPHLKRLLASAQKVEKQFNSIKWKWVPRELNTVADSMCRKALKEYKKRPKAKKPVGATPAIIEKNLNLQDWLSRNKPKNFPQALYKFLMEQGVTDLHGEATSGSSKNSITKYHFRLDGSDYKLKLNKVN